MTATLMTSLKIKYMYLWNRRYGLCCSRACLSQIWISGYLQWTTSMYLTFNGRRVAASRKHKIPGWGWKERMKTKLSYKVVCTKGRWEFKTSMHERSKLRDLYGSSGEYLAGMTANQGLAGSHDCHTAGGWDDRASLAVYPSWLCEGLVTIFIRT